MVSQVYCSRDQLAVPPQQRVGYLAYDAHAADLLFQVVSRRYEQKSLVVTTNLPFKQWDTVFPNAACAVALIDRLTHHAEIITIEGESYRKREAEQAQKAKQAPKPQPSPKPKS
jgi:IstB-like ATP binding protein